jgi:hypothetical protein
MFIKSEYRHTARRLQRLDDLVSVVETSLPHHAPNVQAAPAQPTGNRTAVLLVNGYGGVGLHSLLAVMRLFGKVFNRYVFVQIGQIDVATFKGVQELDGLINHTRQSVDRYVQLMNRNGYQAEGIAVSGLDINEEVIRLTPELMERYPNCVFFGGQLVFKDDSFVTRVLHNYTIFEIQRSLYQLGVQFVILPIRV